MMDLLYIQTSPGNFDCHDVENNNADYRLGTKYLDDVLRELEYLRWFKQHADFGPADGDVHMMMDEQYESETGNKVPTKWRNE